MTQSVSKSIPWGDRGKGIPEKGGWHRLCLFVQVTETMGIDQLITQYMML